MALLSGWPFYRLVTVTNANADYQTKVLIGKTSDAVGEDVDCNGHVADDFDDLRFTGADGTTLLDYWIELIEDSGGTKLATVWVQNNSTPDTTLYMYYGGEETAVSNGANTFVQFDDFEWGSDGDPITDNGGGITWSIGAGDVDISTEQAHAGTRSMKVIGNAAYSKAHFPLTAGEDYAIRFRIYKEDAAYCFISHSDSATTMYIRVDTDETIDYYDGAAYQDTGDSVTADDWNLLEFRDFDWTNKTVDIILDDVVAQDDADISYASSQDEDRFRFTGDSTPTRDTYIDNVIVRKWAATEPSFSFGSEQIARRGYGFVNFQDPGIV